MERGRCVIVMLVFSAVNKTVEVILAFHIVKNWN